MTNYASPYTPNYGAPAAAYAQSYDPNAAYAQALQQQAAQQQLQQMYGGDYNAQQYPMVYTGQLGPMVAAEQPKLTPLQMQWWQEPTFGVPRWGLAAGALALTGIGLAWQAGVFGKMGRGSSRTTTRTTRRSTARDATRSRSVSASSSDMPARKRSRRAGGRKRRAGGGARGRRR